MIKLTYTSVANHALSDAELETLLKQSRSNNADLDITGMMLYDRGRFVQMLEGKPEQVEELYNKICMDDRNSEHIVLEKSSVDNRVFDGWTMAFKRVTEQDRKSIDGYDDFYDNLSQGSTLSDPAANVARIMNAYIELL